MGNSVKIFLPYLNFQSIRLPRTLTLSLESMRRVWKAFHALKVSSLCWLDKKIRFLVFLETNDSLDSNTMGEICKTSVVRFF